MKIIIIFSLLILSPFSWSQYKQSSYEKFYKALEKKKYKKAEKELKKISLNENDNFILLLTRGQYFFSIGNLDSASYYLGNSLGYASFNPINYSSNEFNRIRDSLFKNTISIYDKIILKNPSPINYGDRGAYKLELGLLEESLLDFKKSILLDSNNHITFYNLGIAYRRMGFLDSAILSYDHSISINVNYTPAYLNKGFVYIKKGEFENALKEFNKSLKLNNTLKDLSFIINNIGYCYYELKQYELARKTINESININALNSYAYKNLALIEIELNNKKAACEAIEKSIELGFVYNYGDEILKLKKDNCEE